MSKREWMMEQIEMYCDADRRSALMAERADEAERYCPTIAEAYEVMGRRER